MRRRILAATIAVVAAAIGAFAVPLAISTQDNVRAREVAELGQEATRLLGALPDFTLDRTDLTPLPRHDPSTDVAVYDRRGRRLAGIGPANATAAVRGALRGTVTDDRSAHTLEVATPVHDERAVIGAVRVSEPWAVVARAAQRRWLAELAVAIAVLAVASAAAALISRRLTAPLDELVAVAVRLGHGDFGSRVTRSGVPELDLAADALNRTAEQLDELLTAERSFTADVAHQINTPLTSLRLGLEAALLADNGELAAPINAAIADVDRLQATVDTLLAVARGRGPQAEPADLIAIGTGLVRRFAIDSRLRGRDVRLDTGVGIPLVHANPEVISVIVTVLIDNAIAHGEGRIDVTLRRRGEGATVAVADQGPGVRDAETSDVFDRADHNGKRLGLALAKRLATTHGLRLELTRATPAATFTLALPGAET